jgi:hypothetical protein
MLHMSLLSHEEQSNTAARLIARRKKYDHTTPVLIELHWLPVKFRYEYKLLVYVFKSLHGMAPVRSN